MESKRRLMLKTVDDDMTSYNGFKWKKRGMVTCSDWENTPKCGNGLHGLPMGIGDSELLSWDRSAKWLVFEALGGYIEFSDKAKCEKARVLFCGDRKGATDYLVKHGADISKVVGAFQTGGDGSQLTGGDWSQLCAGSDSQLSGGMGSRLLGGMRSHLSGGDWSQLTGSEWSQLSGGDGSVLSGGFGSRLSGGDWNHLMAGDGSQLTGGDWSQLCAGSDSQLSGGIGSALIFLWWDGNCQRVVVGYVEEGGLLSNVKYRLDRNHQIVPVEESDLTVAKGI